MGRILLVRHGESEGNALRLWQGHADYPLSAKGFAEARAVAHVIAAVGVSAVWASPLGRAWATAEAIVETSGHALRRDDRLKEIDIGAASGLTHEQVVERFPERDRAIRKGEAWAFPGQEPPAVFAQRVLGVLEDLLAQDGTVVAVTHGGVIRGMVSHVLGVPQHRLAPFGVRNCAITEVVGDGQGQMVLRRLNDACHLDRRA